MHKKLWCKRSFAPFYKHYIKCEDTKDFQKRIDYNVTNGVVFLERSIEMCPLDVYAFRNEICPHSTYCDTCGRELHYIPLEWAKSKLVNGVSFHYYMIYTCLHGIECNLQKNDVLRNRYQKSIWMPNSTNLIIFLKHMIFQKYCMM